MGKKTVTVLTIAVAVTLAAGLAAIILRGRKPGYIRPANFTYTFVYE